MCPVTAMRPAQRRAIPDSPQPTLLASGAIRALTRADLASPFHYGWGRRQRLRTATHQRLRWSESVWSPPPESNRRPHPYHGSAAKRRANPRSRRSFYTVSSVVMGSVPASKGKAAFAHRRCSGSRGLCAPERCARRRSRRSPASVSAAISWHRSGQIPLCNQHGGASGADRTNSSPWQQDRPDSVVVTCRPRSNSPPPTAAPCGRQPARSAPTEPDTADAELAWTSVWSVSLVGSGGTVAPHHQGRSRVSWALSVGVHGGGQHDCASHRHPRDARSHRRTGATLR